MSYRFIIRTGLTAGGLVGALLLSGCHGGSRPNSTPTSSTPASSNPVPTVSTGTSAGPAPTDPATAPVSSTRPATAIPGRLFYADEDLERARYVRLNASAIRTVLTGSAIHNVEVAPDGGRIAYVVDGNLMVANVDGSKARKVRSGVVEVGFGPSWSPDGRTLLIALPRESVGTVRLSDGKFTRLPKQLDGIHHRFTGDGRRVFFANGRCTIFSGKLDGTDVKQVPVLGLDSKANPRRLRACDIVSLNHDGSRMTVDLHVGNDTDGDIGGSTVADAVVETATGKVVAIPVRGKIRAVLYRADGTLLVSSESGKARTLTLFSPEMTVLARMAEPAAVKDYWLRDYTR